MDRLPHHLLVAILREVVGPECPTPQLSVLRVSSSFYLAAIPSLYDSPRIASKVASFFLHREAPIPNDFESLSSESLVAIGLTKLAAFRHVRKLIILPDIEYLAEDDPDLQMTDEQKKKQQNDLAAELVADYNKARISAKMLKPGCLPKLESVQGGRPAARTAAMAELKPYPEAAELIGSLVRISGVKICCIHPGGTMWPTVDLRLRETYFWNYDEPPRWRSHIVEQEPHSLPIVNIHCTYPDQLSIPLGTTVNLYVHPHPIFSARIAQGPTLTEAQVDQFYIRWLAPILRHSAMPPGEQEGKESFPETIARTHISIVGVVGSAKDEWGDDYPEGHELSRARRVVAQAKELSVWDQAPDPVTGEEGGEERPELRKLDIVARLPGEMPPCMTCGKGVA